MDSEESATLTTFNRTKRTMVHANKKRVVEVIQCSGEDMNLVLTNGIPTMPTMPTPAQAFPQYITAQRPMLSPSEFSCNSMLCLCTKRMYY